MEKEICRKETIRKITTAFKYLAYACLAFAAFCLTFTLVVIAIQDGWEYLLKFDLSYIIPTVIAIAFAILGAFFFGIDRKIPNVTMYLTLTDKRIYSQIATSKIEQFESYNLNAITYYRLTKRKAEFTLILKTSTKTARFIVDEEFYNDFVNAVNATINVIE